MSEIDETLLNAVCSCNKDDLKELLRKGADVNVLDENGVSLLGRAIQLGNEEIIHIIINAKHFLPRDTSVDHNIENARRYAELLNWETKVLELRKNEGYLHETAVLPGTSERVQNSVENKNSCGLGLFHSLRSFAIKKNECDVNLPDYYDRMPIHYAAESGNVNVVCSLLQAGCLVNVSDNNSITPLHLAVKSNHEAIVDVLLNAGSRVNCKTSDKSSALHIACSRGFITIAQMLLKRGANIEVLDSSDQTPLHVAVKRGHLKVAKALLLSGCKTNVEEIHGYTPLCEAVWNNDINMVRMLLEAGAKINSQHNLLHFSIRSWAFGLCRLLVHYGVFLNNYDDTGESPMHVAIRVKDVDIMKLLLNSGSLTSVTCASSGKTVIHLAVECILEDEIELFYEVIDLLLHHGASLNTESSTPGETPLLIAILLDKFKFAEELIRQGSNPNLGNVFTCAIDNLGVAIRTNNFRLVKLLVYSGFQINWKSYTAAIRANSVSSDIHDFMVSIHEKPMALSKLCRISVRHNMQEHLKGKVENLGLPTMLKNYLLFKDSEFC